MMDSGRSQMGNFKSGKLVVPLLHLLSSTIQDYDPTAQGGLFLPHVGDQGERLGAGTQDGNIKVSGSDRLPRLGLPVAQGANSCAGVVVCIQISLIVDEVMAWAGDGWPS